MASDKIHVFNDLNFEQEVLKSNVPVLVDFTATWCGPCKALAPIVDQLAAELDGSVKVGKLDIDDSPITAGKLGVRGVPTVMVFKNGERSAQHVGLTTKAKLADLVKNLSQSVPSPSDAGTERRSGSHASSLGFRRRRLYWLPFGVLSFANLSFALALSLLVPAGFAAALAALLYLVMVPRFIAQMRDRRRPRWITLLVDQPLFVHFGASTSALLLSPMCLVVALLALGLSGVPLFDIWRTGLCVAYALGIGLSVWATWVERRFVRVRRFDAQIADLPAEFEGYRVAQLSDLHVGSFDPKRRALEWAALSNALEPDLVTVTGDLVTSGTAFYADVAEAIAALRANDGVFVSMGNHDQSNNDELSRLVAARGPTVLRNQAHVIQRGTASLVIAGLDGRIASSAEAARVVQSCTTGAPMILLSHYPWTFEAAAAAGADLVLSGHTHGGQLAVPFFSRRFNLARLTGQRSRGLYHSGKTAMYVNAGLGTTGPPMRLAVPPEIVLITLRRAQASR